MNNPDPRDWQWEEFHNHHLYNDREDGERYPDLADDPDDYLQDLLKQVRQKNGSTE